MIIASSPVSIAPISGPMLPVSSITSASEAPSTLKSAVLVPLAPTGTLSLSLGSVSAAQSLSSVFVRYSYVKSVSMRVYLARPSRYWGRPRAARRRRRSPRAGRR